MHNLGVTPTPSHRALKALARARRYVLFENWTWSDPDTAARRRASWPAWRRAIRPIGAAAYWACAIAGLVLDPSWRTAGTPLRVLIIAGLVIVGACVVFGTVDGFRQRRIDRVRGGI